MKHSNYVLMNYGLQIGSSQLLQTNFFGISTQNSHMSRVLDELESASEVDESWLQDDEFAGVGGGGGGRLCSGVDVREYLSGMVPFAVYWLPTYQRMWLLYDIIAGTVVTSMSVPQSLAYALLASMPPITGLYSSLVPPVIYFCFGTSPYTVLGPSALTAILADQTARSVSPMAGDAEHTQLVTLVSFFAGLFLLLFWMLRLGWVTRYFSSTVMKGFVTGSGLIIALSQIKWVFGLHIAEDEVSSNTLVAFVQTLMQLGGTNGWAVLISGIGLMFMVIFRSQHVPKWWPGSLFLVVASTLMSYGLQLPLRANIRVVGIIPSGLPPFSVPPLADYGVLVISVLPGALTVAIVSYIGQIALGQLYARRNNEPDVDPSRELLALGLANFVTAFTPSQPASASFSKTSVNERTGNKTQVSGLVGVLLLILILELLTSALVYLPMAILAVIVLDSCISLVDYAEFLFLVRVAPAEAVLFAVTVLAVLGFGIQWGLFFSLLLSLLYHIYSISAVPITREFFKRGGAVAYEEFDTRLFHDPVITFFIPGSVFFGSAHHMANILTDVIAYRKRKGLQAVRQVIVFDMASVLDFDATTIHQLEQSLSVVLKEPCLRVFFAALHERPKHRLRRSNVDRLIDPPFHTVDAAVRSANEWVAQAQEEEML